MSYSLNRDQTASAFTITEDGETLYHDAPKITRVQRKEYVAPKPVPYLPPYHQRVIAAVCDELSVSNDAVMGQGRFPQFVEARALICQILRKHNAARYSTTLLGRMLGGRDHSTIINLLSNWEMYCKRSPHLIDACDKIMRNLEAVKPEGVRL